MKWWGLWVVFLVLLVVGIILTLIKFTAQPADTGLKVVALVAGEQFKVTVNGEELWVTDALLKNTTPVSYVKKQCGEDLKKLDQEGIHVDSSGNLTNDVVVVKYNADSICIGDTPKTIGPSQVSVENAAYQPSADGHKYMDNGQPIYFRKLGFRAVSNTADNLITVVGGVVIAIAAGIASILIAEGRRRGRLPKAQKSDEKPSEAQKSGEA